MYHGPRGPYFQAILMLKSDILVKKIRFSSILQKVKKKDLTGIYLGDCWADFHDLKAI